MGHADTVMHISVCTLGIFLLIVPTIHGRISQLIAAQPKKLKLSVLMRKLVDYIVFTLPPSDSSPQLTQVYLDLLMSCHSLY